MSTIMTIPAMIVLALIIILPFIVGFFVYRDARQRDMNALLWACFHWPHHLLSGSWELRQSQMPAVRNTSKRVLHGMPQVRRQTPSILSKLQGTGGVGLEGLPSMYHSTSGNPDGHSGSGTPQGSNWVEGACSYNPCTNLFDRSFDFRPYQYVIYGVCKHPGTEQRRVLR